MPPDTLSPQSPVEVDQPAERLVVDDPAADAAPVARELARMHCPTDGEGGDGCDWYHGYMLYWSLLSQKTPRSSGRNSIGWHPAHSVFFHDEFRRLAQYGNFSRVVFSGSADHMMPSLVFDAYRSQAAALDMTLVDLCETPLRLNKWYAGRRGFDIDTVRSDIFDYEPAKPFDVLCTHHFLNFIPPARRPDLFRKWRGVLRDGGKLVFINSIRPIKTAQKVAESGGTTEQNLATAMAEAERRQNLKFPPFDEIFEATFKRDAQLHFYTVQSAEEVAELVRGAGFTVDCVDQFDSESEVLPASTWRANINGAFGLVATAR